MRVLRGTQTSQATLVVSCRLGRLLGDTPYGAEEKNLRVTVLYDYAENKYAAHVLVHLCRQLDLLLFFLNLAVQLY